MMEAQAVRARVLMGEVMSPAATRRRPNGSEIGAALTRMKQPALLVPIRIHRFAEHQAAVVRDPFQTGSRPTNGH
jgi:hypothetical protein